ncbi:MAG: membrane protein insertion efficiency factor YidD [Thermodesulfobacteriota bacterium]|nr:membrane protein insertion efficiency factor YidD [Thermodesulfobacteriota bacterium]
MKKILASWLIISGFLLSCACPGKMSKGHEHGFNPLLSILDFYQGPLNHLSAVKQGECHMYPSCSEYSKQCIEKHGFFIGWMMTCDRLMRCGRDEIGLSPKILVNGEWKCYDPVENNEF